MPQKIGDFNLNKIYCIDCIDGMKKLPSNSIDLVVTSPPYDNLRDYEGYNLDLHDLGKEIYRVLKEGSVAVSTKSTARNYIGFDISQLYCDIATKRLYKTNKSIESYFK